MSIPLRAVPSRAIYSQGPASPISTVSHSTMLVLKDLFISLAIISSVVGATHIHKKETCSTPAVRKEWRALTKCEKAAWIKAVNCLSHLPHDDALTATVDPSVSLIPSINASGSYYNDIVYAHMDLNPKIHFTGFFLPWHRHFLNNFEHALKTKCRYIGATPYWNWTRDAHDFYESSFWKGTSHRTGLGGWGDPDANFSVPDGGFTDLQLLYPSPHKLCRNFTLYAFNGFPPQIQQFFPNPQKQANSSFHASNIRKILETPTGDFKNFQTALEAFEGPHSALHVIVGCDLAGSCPPNAPPTCIPGPKWSPNDPLFFLHHAMIDKIWYDWQRKDPINAKSFYGGSVQHLESMAAHDQYPNGGPPFLNLTSTIPMDGLFPEVTIDDVMDTTGGSLCYIYE